MDLSGTKQDRLKVGEQYNPLAVGINSGTGTGEVVFAGYGITAKDLNYDDYANVDVAGKVVIVLRKEPNHAPFGKSQPSGHAFFSTKAVNAAAHKAAAMIVVNDQRTLANEKNPGTDKLLEVEEAGRGTPRGFRIPVYFVKREPLEALVKESLGVSLTELENTIDQTGEPATRELKGARIEFATELKRDQVMAKNVIAELPGVGALADQTVILGAHYDHVGMGGMGSLAPGTIAVHNGADDNGSGTVAMLEATRQIVQRAQANATKPRRRIVFMAFTGEERGLLGSKHYVDAPRWPLEDTVAMVNLDMVGRLINDELTVYGTGSGTQLGPLVREEVQRAGLKLDEQPTGYGPSDHQSFYERGIPVLHFFTGLHNDYHRPTDDFAKINLNGLSRITDIVGEVVWKLALTPERPLHQQTGRGGDMRQQPRPVLGVTLDLEKVGTGAVITSVVPNGAAAKAGLQAGDRVTSVEGVKIEDSPQLKTRIEAAGVGQSLRLGVVRGEESLEILVQLAGDSRLP